MKTKKILAKLFELEKSKRFVEIVARIEKHGVSYFETIGGQLTRTNQNGDFVLYKSGRADQKFNIKDVRHISAMETICGWTDCIDKDD